MGKHIEDRYARKLEEKARKNKLAGKKLKKAWLENNDGSKPYKKKWGYENEEF